MIDINIPPVMFIESAMELATSRSAEDTARELKEFHMLGDRRQEEFKAKLPEGTPDMAVGYLLGLETARVMLAMSPKAAAAGVQI